MQNIFILHSINTENDFRFSTLKRYNGGKMHVETMATIGENYEIVVNRDVLHDLKPGNTVRIIIDDSTEKKEITNQQRKERIKEFREMMNKYSRPSGVKNT